MSVAQTKKPAARAATTPVARLSNGLTALEAHAIKCLAKHAEPLRDSLCVGDGQQVDFTVRVCGTVNVAEDTKADVEKFPKLAVLVGLLLAAMPDDVRTKAQRAVAKRCAEFVATGEEPELSRSEHSAAIELLASIAHHKTQERRGAVTSSPTVELVSRARRKAA